MLIPKKLNDPPVNILYWDKHLYKIIPVKTADSVLLLRVLLQPNFSPPRKCYQPLICSPAASQRLMVLSAVLRRVRVNPYIVVRCQQ